MTDWASAPQDFAGFEPRRRSRAPIPQSVLCALVLVATTSIGLWAFYTEAPVESPTIHAPRAAQGHGTVSRVAPTTRAGTIYGALIKLTSQMHDIAPTFGQDTPLRADVASLRGPLDEVRPFAPIVPAMPQAQAASDLPLVAPVPADSDLAPGIPLPPPRPALLRPSVPSRSSETSPMAPSSESAVSTPPASQPSFFEKLFGRPQPSGTALAYAPESGGLGSFLSGRPDTPGGQTAIYDISAHMVILPDGTRLEAHSGLGTSHDDPRSVAEHMHGATPPNVYSLDLREAPFHGVRALRLTPVGNGDTYGRGGLLAHSYMLGPHGDSNGCVVFKNYDAFLQAFESGQVKRLMVVARLE